MTNIIAHRGLRSNFPENTLSAINAALKIESLKFIEFDVELAKDGVVVLHQETLVTDSNFKKLVLADRDFTSRDWVIDKSVNEIKTLDAGSWFSAEFSNEKVPTLKEVLNLDWNNKIPCIELKDATFWGEKDLNRPNKIVTAIIADLKQFQGEFNIISFNPEILKVVKTHFPKCTTTLALWTEWKDKAKEAVTLTKSVSADAITIPDILVLEDREWLSVCKQNKISINVYPITPARNEPEFENWTAESQYAKWQKLNELGVDGITSDFAVKTIEALW
jgi:glycerophosphoryl diester phosphodiesterase